jgi:RNA polymerase sigma-70 factor (ECF subfamily)
VLFNGRTVTKSGDLHLLKDDDRRAAEYAALVRRAADGDAGAMEDLLIRAQEVAFRFSFLACGHTEDAEDVMQDALLRTYRHVGRIRQPEAFRAWLYRTVRNACLMKRRRRIGEPARHVSLDSGEITGGDGDSTTIDVADRAKMPDQVAINRWLGARLRTALSALPPELRVLVFLRDMESLSTREVAQVLRISEPNVKTRLHRARVILRKQLEDL